MNFLAFSQLLSGATEPVVLLEGTRNLPPERAPYLTKFASALATAFPRTRFRSGNATGSDAAFAEGVARVDSSRLELVVPYGSHRARQRPFGSTAVAMDDLPAERLQEMVDVTCEASPKYQRVAVNYHASPVHPRLLATAQLILRDTLKVMGGTGMPQPVAGLFHVDTAEPGRGGTGHTMRICNAFGVPVITQLDWLGWIF